LDALFGINDRHDGLDAVVHLAAAPAGGASFPTPRPSTTTCRPLSMLFRGARRAPGIKTIVPRLERERCWSIPFETPPPYIPLDEEYDKAREHLLGNETASRRAARPKAGALGSQAPASRRLRFSGVMEVADYAPFRSFDAGCQHPQKWNSWGYIDAQDGAQAVERALALAKPGFEAYIIAAADAP
jgi:hypothetical protein